MALFNRETALVLLSLLLRPVARFCIRHSLKLQDVVDGIKVELVRVGAEELRSRGERCNTSRLSVMTGMHRRDVSKLESGATVDTSGKDLITKVIARWQTDSRFCRTDGVPRVLSLRDGLKSDFAQLVASISQDVNHAAVLGELKRVGAIEEKKTGVALVKSSYVPVGDVKASFSICARDIEDLTCAVEHNLLNPKEIPNLHARTEYDNVRPEAIESIRCWFLKEGHQFQAKVREFISQHDQDLNPQMNYRGKGVKVMLGMFSHIHNL